MDRKIENYFAALPTPQKEICVRLRELIFRTYPDIKEEFKWGVPVYGGRYYIGALRDHVNLGFSINGLSPEKLKLFEGNGKTMRHVKIRQLTDIEETKLVKLLKIAATANGCQDTC
jgi:hypothetical protein